MKQLRQKIKKLVHFIRVYVHMNSTVYQTYNIAQFLEVGARTVFLYRYDILSHLTIIVIIFMSKISPRDDVSMVAFTFCSSACNCSCIILHEISWLVVIITYIFLRKKTFASFYSYQKYCHSSSVIGFRMSNSII